MLLVCKGSTMCMAFMAVFGFHWREFPVICLANLTPTEVLQSNSSFSNPEISSETALKIAPYTGTF